MFCCGWSSTTQHFMLDRMVSFLSFHTVVFICGPRLMESYHLEHSWTQAEKENIAQLTLTDDAVKVLHSICQQIWKTQQWPQDWKRSVFITIPKKGHAKKCSNYRTIALISHTSKIMLKILQSRLQQYMNRELPDVQAGFRKGRGIRDQIANIRWIIKKAREFQFSSVQFSCSVVFNSLRPHELQHARPPCPSPTLRVHSNSCPSSR